MNKGKHEVNDATHQDSVRGTLQPIEKAMGLPSHLYRGGEAAAAEREGIFFNTWSALTHAKNTPDKGSVLPINFLGMPLLVLRNHVGVIKVFQNVCRHRGMRLVEERGKLKGPITCPYHAWAYDLDGTLKSTPHVGGANIHHHDNINPSEMGLIEVRSHVWRDVVFVNVNGDCAPFEETHKELLDRWKEFDCPLYHGGADSGFSLELKSNWKLAVDNYCESYHLPFVHPNLNSYSRLEDHYNIVGKSGFAGQGTLVYSPSLSEDGQRFPDFAGLSSKWDTAAEYIALFPNLLLGVHRDHAYSIVIEPRGHGVTVEHVELYYPSVDCLGDDYAGLRTSNAKLWQDVFEEDISVVEGMYEGRKAPGYDGGRFSPVMEEATYRFHYWIAENMP
jgi:phenylpropionate dioxygenase-like ring-hydroxylating dioxygenase large terminal subunit